MTRTAVTRARSRATTALAVGALAGLLIAGCTNREPPRFDAARHPHATVTATVGPGGVQRVDINADDDDRFLPDTVVVHPGKVTIVVHNLGVVPHTLEIPGLHVDTGNIGKHQVKSVTFSVDEPAVYPFDCAYHVPLHMVGTLKVVRR
ncbi:MAG: cupredoxin domain-containing protein [Frankiaceae bacterium]